MSLFCDLMEPATGFMQRFGYLKILMSLTSKSKVTSYEKLYRQFWAEVGKNIKINLEKNKDIKEYIINKRLYGKKNKYSKLVYNGDTLTTNEGIYDFNVQKHDLSLCDKLLPSYTGSITKDSGKDIIDWSVILNLLNSPRYSQTNKGNIVNILFNQNIDSNPFLLSFHEKIYFLYIFLQLDHCIIYNIIYKIYNEKKYSVIDRYEAGKLLKNTYIDLYDKYKNKVRINKDIKKIRKIKSIIESIERQDKKNKKILGTKELRVTARLEPLVDLGILKKTNKYAYKYALSSNVKNIIPTLKTVIDNQYNDDYFFSFCNDLYALKASKETDNSLIFKYLLRGYEEIKNPLGLAPIDDSSVLGGIFALKEGHLIEKGEMITSLKIKDKKYGKKIRLHVDKHGMINFFVIEQNLINDYLI